MGDPPSDLGKKSPELALVLVSLLLFIDEAAGIPLGLARLGLSYLLCWLLPGLVLLRIIGASKGMSLLEQLAISVPLSYSLVGLLSLATLTLDVRSKAVALTLSTAAEGVAGLAISRRVEAVSPGLGLYHPNDWIVLLALIGTRAAFTVVGYPEIAYLPDTDMVRHYAGAIILWRTPLLYGKPVEIFFSYPPFLRAHLGAFIYLSRTPDAVVMSATSSVSWVLPLAFYATAGALAGRRWRRFPAAAAALGDLSIYSTGFPWLRRLVAGGLSKLPFELLSGGAYLPGLVYDAKFAAILLTLAALWVIFSLPRRRDLSAGRGALIIFLLVLANQLTHVVEGALLSVAVAALNLSGRRWHGRPVTLGSAAALASAGAAFIALDRILPVYSIGAQEMAACLLPALFLVSSEFMLRTGVGLGRPGWAGRLRRTIIGGDWPARAALAAALYVYFLGLVVWIDVSGWWGGIRIAKGSVPWYGYAATFGLSGILSIFSLKLLGSTDDDEMRGLLTLVTFAGLCLIAGSSISEISARYGLIRYWEWRLVRLAKLPLSLLAGLTLTRVGEAVAAGGPSQRRAILRRSLTVIAIASIVLYEGGPTLVGSSGLVRLAHIRAPDASQLADLSAAREVFEGDPEAYPLAITTDTLTRLTLAAPPLEIVPLALSLDTLRAYTPEATLAAMYWPPPYTHPYLYVDKRRDLGPMGGTYVEGMLRNMRPAYESENALLYNLSRYSPVSGDGEVAFLVASNRVISPNDASSLCLLAFARLGYSVTTFLDMDPAALQKDVIVVPYDPPFDNGTFLTLHAPRDDVSDWTPSWVERVPLEGLDLPGTEAEEAYLSFRLAPMVQTDNINLTLDLSLPRGIPLNSVGYIGVIFSYESRGNFSLLELFFTPAGEIYGALRIVNGESWTEAVTIPRRYRKLGDWEPGGQLTMQVRVRPDVVSLSINGEEVFQGEVPVPPGRVGVARGRAHSPVLKTFEAEYYQRIAWGDWGPYLTGENLLSIAESGRSVVVYNLNGYNYFSELLMRISAKLLNSTSVSGLVSGTLPPTPVEVSEARATGEVSVLANYTTPEGSISPYILRLSVKGGEVYLVNAFPIFRHVREIGGVNRDVLDRLYSILAPMELIGEELGVQKVDKNVEEGYYVKGLSGADMRVEAKSAVLFGLPENLSSGSSGLLSVRVVDLRADGEEVLSVDNCSQVGLSADEGLLRTGSVEVGRGPLWEGWSAPSGLVLSGLYYPVTLSSPLVLGAWSRGPLNVLVARNGSAAESRLLTLPPGSYAVEVTPINGSVAALFRRPTLELNGTLTIYGPQRLEFVPYHASTLKDRRVILEGEASLAIGLVDRNYLLISEVSFSGEWFLDPPLEGPTGLIRTSTLLAALTITPPILIAVLALRVLNGGGSHRSELNEDQTTL